MRLSEKWWMNSKRALDGRARGIATFRESGAAMKKRTAAWLLGMLTLVVPCLPHCPAMAAGKPPADYPPVVFKDKTYDFELRRTLGRAYTGGADLNECLAAAHKIKEGDGESWYRAWFGLAQKVDRRAQTDMAKGRKLSARNGWFKASNYYRAAPFFLHGDSKDPRIIKSWRKSRDTFRQAIKHLPYPAKAVSIPYEKTTLPGYFMRPSAGYKPRKTLIAQTGFDGTGEELFYSIGRPALERGYNLLIFEGPGQGGALRAQGLYFRHDWDKVVTPVVDFALRQKGVDPKRIALAGESMGGYLVPRAAAVEHRLAAIVANPGSVDLRGKGFPKPDALAWMIKHPDKVNQDFKKAMAKSTGLRWFINNGMYTCGKKTPLDFLVFWGGFELGDLVKKIKSPTLVIVGHQDVFYSVKEQKALYGQLTCPKTMLDFSGEYYAGQHCQMGAGSVGPSAILDWLDGTLSRAK